jgi:hypothetical protein
MRRDLSLLLLLSACAGSTKPGEGPSGDDSGSPPPPADLSAPLGPEEARAGVVTDPAALPGGPAAEGRPGDIKLYNDRAVFIVQGIRPGDYYAATGGAVIDADIVRPTGAPGADLIDETGSMVGLGRITDPSSVEVVDPGGPGRAAVVRVRGVGTPFTLLTGAFENPDFIAPADVAIETTYTLAPGSPLLAVETTFTWESADAQLQLGDLVLYGLEGAEAWSPGRGLDGGPGERGAGWVGFVGQHNEVAFGLFGPEAASYPVTAVQDILDGVGPILSTLTPLQAVRRGESVAFRRWYGVGPDLATLTGAWAHARGVATEVVGGRVVADDGPVAGARVTLLDAAGAPVTLAVAGSDGVWEAPVEAAGLPGLQAVASGRADAVALDLPDALLAWGPHAEASVNARCTAAGAASPARAAEARGWTPVTPVVAGPGNDFTLGTPARVTVRVADGGPAVVRADRLDADPFSSNPGIVRPRLDGRAGWLYLADGEGSLPLDPGSYRILVHRGLRHEPATVELTVAAGEDAAVEVALPVAFTLPGGVFAGDPHSHAGPSPDGRIPMAARLLSQAAHGLDLHFGTDHDHIVSYAPLLAATGLDAHLATIEAIEVSPVLRGHINAWPAGVADAPNGGAPRWWELDADTPARFADMRAVLGEGIVLQANHPTPNGLFGFARFDRASATIGRPTHWSDDFDAVEVLNDGDWEAYTADWLALVGHGLRTAPVGVSDAHGFENGSGANLTWMHLGDAGPTPDGVRAAGQGGETVAALGVYVDARVGGEWAPGRTFPAGTTLTVAVYAASFVGLGTVELLENGVPVASAPLAAGSGLRGEASFSLAPAADAHYVVQVRGAGDLSPVYPGKSAVAIAAPVYVDVGGDGWVPPLGSLRLGG